MLELGAMAFAKLSSAFLVARVAPQTQRQMMILRGIVGFWTVYSLLAFAFQCGLPQPWKFERSKCAHGGPLFSVIALNILSDLILAAWVIPILRPLHMVREKRITVAVLFGSRAVVALIAGVQIWTAVKALHGSDPTWDGFDLAILSQTVASLSLIVASLPRIKRFIGVAGSGMVIPTIHETEIALSTRHDSRAQSRTGNAPLKLIPSNSTKYTTTIMSGRSNKKEKGKAHPEWQKFVSMGSKQDEHTSTSSLFDHEGVLRQQEVTVKIEEGGSPER
jgi:hypothetical protein